MCGGDVGDLSDLFLNSMPCSLLRGCAAAVSLSGPLAMHALIMDLCASIPQHLSNIGRIISLLETR